MGVGPEAVAVVGLIAVCPGGAVTGGPHAMHQLVHTANKFGSAAMMYLPDIGSSVPEQYRGYDIPITESVPDGALVVLPEIWPDLAKMFPYNRVALWWLSVDNFGSHGQRNLSGIDLHLCQSVYAARHVKFKVGKPSLMLTDWVTLPKSEVRRGPRVAINPAKDAGLLRRFVKARPDLEFVELRGLDAQGVADALASCQVYVEFGANPGRDRPPREAALAGCVVASVLTGSARHDDDMPLGAGYKFNDLREASAIVDSVLADYERHHRAQQPYRFWVHNQRTEFEREVRELLAE